MEVGYLSRADYPSGDVNGYGEEETAAMLIVGWVPVVIIASSLPAMRRSVELS